MLYVKADDESILPYGEEVQRRQTVFMPLDLSTVVLGIGISISECGFTTRQPVYFNVRKAVFLRRITDS